MISKKAVVLSLAVASLSACSSYDTKTASNTTIEQKTQRIQTLESELEKSQVALEQERATRQATPVPQMSAASNLLPPGAKPGECYARVWVEPQYKMLTKQVLVQPESTRVQTLPAQYEWTTEQVMVGEASSKVIEIPAEFRTEAERLLVSAEQRTWKTELQNGSPASAELLAAAQRGGINLDAAPINSCYHEHVKPAEMRQVTQQVEVAPASYRIQTVPAEYRWVEKRILVKEASSKLVEVPAKFESYTEQVLDKPAHTTWKKGTGPVQRIDEATGEIMCLVEVPASYKSITGKRLVSAATIREVAIPAEYETVKVKELVKAAGERRIEIPAKFESVTVTEKVSEPTFIWHEVHDDSMSAKSRTGSKICLTETPARYKTVKRQVLVTPASTRTVEIPASFESKKVRKLVKAAEQRTTTIPAKYETVNYRELMTDGKMDWRSILCETNMTPGLVSKLQSTLNQKGYAAGPADGIIGAKTIEAVNAYQADNKLPRDKYLNIETMKHLELL